MANTPPSARPRTMNGLRSSNVGMARVGPSTARVEPEFLLCGTDVRQVVVGQFGDFEAILDLHHLAIHRRHRDVRVVRDVEAGATVEVPRLAPDVAGEVGDAAERLVDALLGDVALDPEQRVRGDAPGEVAHLSEA